MSSLYLIPSCGSSSFTRCNPSPSSSVNPRRRLSHNTKRCPLSIACCRPSRLQASIQGSNSVQTLSPQEEDMQNIRDVLRMLELLRTKRDMTLNEVKLTIIIEDPREVERRQQLGIEDERGCSREEMAAALVDVYEGRIPSDRLVLRELAKELLSWPRIEDEEHERTSPVQSPYARVTDTGVDPVLAAQRAKLDWDAAAEIQPGDETKKIGEMLPPAVGFSVLYLFSAIPILIAVVVVVILFLNSFK